jgi:hypothetical protein
MAGTRQPSATGDGVTPSLQILPHRHMLLARSPAPYSPFRQRPHSPTAFSGPWPASLPPASSSLTHAHRMDGFCNQNAYQLGSLAGLSLLTVYVGVVEYAPDSLPPASSSLTHARRMDGFNQPNAYQLGSLAGLSLLTVYVGVVECVPASLPPSILLPHTCTQDGWFLQPKRRPAWLPRRTVPSDCICRCSSMRARLSPPRVLLPHTCTQDGWVLQPKRLPARLPRRTVPSNCICRCSRMRARLSPPRVLLPHTWRSASTRFSASA